MNSNKTYKPKGFPNKLKLLVRSVPVIIDYEAGEVVTPKKADEEVVQRIFNYLAEEGFLVNPEERNNGESEGEHMY
jgi:hypothetical protein